jgi:hypothetical protein
MSDMHWTPIRRGESILQLAGSASFRSVVSLASMKTLLGKEMSCKHFKDGWLVVELEVRRQFRSWQENKV